VSRRAAAVGLLVVLALFAVVLVLRWDSHYSNVDDYLYALQTDSYYEGLRSGRGALLDAWKLHGSNAPLVPMLAMPIAAFDTSPQALVLVQLLPLLLLVASVRSLMTDLGLTGRGGWVATTAIATLAPVLAYAAMYHFALAATACTAFAAAAYARSDRLARVRPALLLGLALGLLALTRVMAPVYVVAVAIPIGVDVLASAPDRLRRLRNGAAAAAVAAIVAAPWWLTTGDAALDYLRQHGYQESAFTRDDSLLGRVGDRLEWTANETGWLLSILLVALGAWAIVRVVRRGRSWRLMAWLLGVVAVGIAFLSTSTNRGTAFALPLVVLLACAAAPGLAQMRPRVRRVALGGSFAVLGVSLVGLFGVVPETEVGDRALWNDALPGVQQARQVMPCDDCDPPDSDRVASDVLDVIGDRPTLIVREDALVNSNGLRFVATERDSAVKLSAPAGVPVPDTQLASVEAVVTGFTLGPYQGGIDLAALERQLRAAGFRSVFTRQLGELNTVAIWARRSG
jgi:hypothetical protein